MNDKVESILKHPLTIPVVVGVLGFGSGVVAGYILGKKASTDEIVDSSDVFDTSRNQDDLAELRAALSRPRPERVVITEEEAVKRNIIDPNDRSALRPDQIEDAVEENSDDDVVVTITEEVTDDIDWNWEEEVGKRTETSPYVLHQEEFYADEKGYSQMTLTFYSGDEIMTDEEDVPIYNHSTVTGELLFGHGSGDPNVVYIRNDTRRAEYEIVQVDGLYSREVLGLEIEDNARVADIKHSKNMKFRME